MLTIKLRVNEKIFSNLMWFLKKFNKEEIQIINENKEFLSVQEYLKNELISMESGNAEFVNIEQLNDELEEVIKKYEA